MQLIFFVSCVLILYAEFITSASVKMTNGKINVDKLLKTVMNSDKFDEIAEKIAEKAVEKFSKLKNLEIIPVSNVNFDGKTAYRVSEADAKEPNNSDPKHDNTVSDIATTHRHFIGKIDTEAFMKKESEDSINHLSLKYKLFTKGTDEINTNERIEKSVKNDEKVTSSTEKNDDKTLEEENKKYEQKVLENKHKKRDRDQKPTSKIKTLNKHSSTKLNELEQQNDDKLTTPQEKDSSENSDEQYGPSVMEDKSTPVSEQKDNLSVKLGSESKKLRAINKDESDEFHNDSSSESETINKGRISNTEEKSDSEYRKRKPVSDYLNLPELSKDVKPQIKKNAMISKVIENRNNNNSLPDRISVREERNKLYTYEKSPDYKDYHNEINHIQKQLKDIR